MSPNNDFINNAVTNWTAHDANVRINLPVGVGYGSNPEQVKDILLQAAHSNPDVLEEPQPDVVFTDYGDNSLNFSLRVWTAKRAHTPVILKSDLYFVIFKLVAENRIELPYPQRDLPIRSSDMSFSPLRAQYRSAAPK